MNTKAYLHTGIWLSLLMLFYGIMDNVWSADAVQPAASVEFYAADVDGLNASSLYGSFTSIYKDRYGVHIEVLNDDASEESLRGYGGHVFVRDDIGLFGVTAARSEIDIAAFNGFPALPDVQLDTVGIEAEIYLGSVIVAFQSGRVSSDLEELDGENYTSVDLYWQIHPGWQFIVNRRDIAEGTTDLAEIDYSTQLNGNWLTIYAGATSGDFDTQYLGVEYSLSKQNSNEFSFIVELDTGEGGYDAVLIGMRYDFAAVDKAPTISLFDRLIGHF